MGNDWYTEFTNQLWSDIADRTGYSKETVRTVYKNLERLDLIDYDLEKEVLMELYGSDEY